MSGVTKAISKDLYTKAVNSLKGAGKTGDVSRKLEAIKSAKEHGISIVSRVFGVSRVTIMAWINDFKEKGTEGLKLKPGRGGNSILTDEEQCGVKSWLFKEPNLTIKAVKIKIAEVFEKKLSLSATHNLIQKLNFSYITPRAKHYKQDSCMHSEFKKNLRMTCQKNPESFLFFFDESRFGTHSKLGHAWFPKGSRTQVTVKLGFKNFYLYKSIQRRRLYFNSTKRKYTMYECVS